MAYPIKYLYVPIYKPKIGIDKVNLKSPLALNHIYISFKEKACSVYFFMQDSVLCMGWGYTLQTRVFGSVMSSVNTQKVMSVPRKCPWQMFCPIIIGSNHH